jgi:Reverse transcriptase (RNA-dependent DNA polymerase)
MTIPEGYARYMLEVRNKVIDPTTNVLQFKKALYGLVHAARKWQKQLKDAMAGCNYFPRKAEPCLFMIQVFGDEPLSFVIIYDDDGRIFGTPEDIKEVIDALSKSFKVQTMGEMNKYVGYPIIDTTEFGSKIAQDSKG